MQARSAAKTIISISVKMMIFALVVMLIYYAGGAAYRFGLSVFHESAKDTSATARTVTVSIPEKPSVMDVSESLLKAGAIEDKYLFYVQAMLSNYSKKFAGGVYTVSTDMTPTELMAAIMPEPTEEETK